VSTLGVRQAELQRVLGGEKRDDTLPWYVPAEVRNQMTEVVFFLGADGAVGEENVGALACQPPVGVLRIDPRIHTLAGRQFGARRAELRRQDGIPGAKSSEDVRSVDDEP
jgi:hypothetical protein